MSKAATVDSYSKNMLHQKVFRTIICIFILYHCTFAICSSGYERNKRF